MYGTNFTESEDLFQEILLQLWKSWPMFKAEAKVSTWVYRVSLNTAITRLRQNKNRPVLQTLTLAQESIKEVSTSRLDILFDKELQAAINQLNKFDKALLLLYLDEKNYREIGEIMGLSESNVGVKINRIKKKLKEIIVR